MEAANTERLTAFNTLSGEPFAALYNQDAVALPPNVQPIEGPLGLYLTGL